MQLCIYSQPEFDIALPAMRYLPKTISLREDVIKKGMARAKFFRQKFSTYVSYLIEKDFESGSKKIVIFGDDPDPEPPKK